MLAKLEPWDMEMVKLAQVGEPCRERNVFENVDFQCWCAKNGYIALLRHIKPYLLPNEELHAHAALGGHVHVMQWLVNNGVGGYSSVYVCGAAARGGHLHVLQWLMARGCQWHPQISYEAVYNGHLHVIKWAMEQGCLLDVDACQKLLGRGSRRETYPEMAAYIDSLAPLSYCGVYALRLTQ
jgi:hypothetical protein